MVVAVGALTVGGSGKTVVVASICEILKAASRRVAVLSRGYGRFSNKVLLVNPSVHNYADVGDEPLMLSRSAQVFVGCDRHRSAALAEQFGVDFLLLDDGIVQRHLQPDLRLVVVDASQGVGNGFPLPLGPNRLNFELIKYDIDGLILLGPDDRRQNLPEIPPSMPLIRGRPQMDLGVVKNRRIISFCGIGYPQKFFDGLNGLEQIKTLEFPDHHPFSERDLRMLIAESRRLEAQLVTTEKDIARIPEKYRGEITAIPLKISWSDEDELRKLLLPHS
jgi:tetraacyldisaccharide 4'-kinase